MAPYGIGNNFLYENVSLPGEHKYRALVSLQGAQTGLDMLDEGWSLALLKSGNEPLALVITACGPAKPDAMAANDY